MNIAQIIDVFYPSVDGVVKVVDNYSKILNSIDDIECSVFAPRIGRRFKDEFSYDVVRSASIPFLGDYVIPIPGLSPSLLMAYNKKQIDIIHAHSPFTMGHFALDAAKVTNTPIVMTFHSKYYEDFYSQTHSKALSKILTDYVVRAYNRADEVWTVSHNAAETLESYGYKKDIVIMPNGNDFSYPSDPEKLKKMAAKRFGVKVNMPTLIFVGRVLQQKNINMILGAMKELKNDGFQMIMVGSGQLDETRKFAEANGFSDKLVLTGEINNKELLSGLYLLSDMLFFPSTYDTFAIVVREAAALKVPSLLVAGSAAAEDITPDVNGFVCENDPAAAVAKIREIFAGDTGGGVKPDSGCGTVETAADGIGGGKLSFSKKAALVGARAQKDLDCRWERLMPGVLERYRALL